MAKATNKKKDLDASAEEKIMTAARAVFTRNGYAATTVRDIAAEADLNFSLVNYYFRSKEKLFELIMLEAIKQLLSGLINLLNDPDTSAVEKIDAVCPKYMDMLLEHPDLPLFVMTGIANNAVSSSEITKALIENNIFLQSYFLKQLQELFSKNKLAIEPLHLLMNMVSMLTMPFVARPMLLRSGAVDTKMFRQMMEDRKQKIPIWLKAMM
ncbi:TetR/AcrR family transcriptional regulator [Chitinophaga sp. Hz27]|uniref:TetR/AcrR family transcriptional regulator n=1 Tax=Chitinophaga sp. Hz27 TaxID=3347169 RepID=UPI0035E1E0D4